MNVLPVSLLSLSECSVSPKYEYWHRVSRRAEKALKTQEASALTAQMKQRGLIVIWPGDSRPHSHVVQFKMLAFITAFFFLNDKSRIKISMLMFLSTGTSRFSVQLWCLHRKKTNFMAAWAHYLSKSVTGSLTLSAWKDGRFIDQNGLKAGKNSQTLKMTVQIWLPPTHLGTNPPMFPLAKIFEKSSLADPQFTVISQPWYTETHTLHSLN